MIGSLSLRMAVIFFRVAAVAVAVRAITEILEGIRLRTSPKFENSVQKYSPLHIGYYIS